MPLVASLVTVAVMEASVPSIVPKEMPWEGWGDQSGLWGRLEQKLQSRGLFRGTEKTAGKLLCPSSISFFLAKKEILCICNNGLASGEEFPHRGLGVQAASSFPVSKAS